MKEKWIKIAAAGGGTIILATLLGLFFLARLFAAPGGENTEAERFIIPLLENTADIENNLFTAGFIKSKWAFNLALSFRGGKIGAGGYKIAKSMGVWQMAGILAGEPYMKWVIIPEGLRKEEIAEVLAKNLGWSEAEKEEWINKDTAEKAGYTEGVYFPETYLIPTDETPADTAKRLIAKFEEKFAPYAKEAAARNIKWTTVVKIASLIQREAADLSDMPLVSGIIWNRLLSDMKLDLDSTLQYARGNTGKGWWAPISAADKNIDSPFNTYKRKGLPPAPIDNPGKAAIAAAVNPEKTDCFYYLHDSDGNIHCAATYKEHQNNINKYLK